MSSGSGIDRRRFMQLAGLSGAAVLAGCKQSESGARAARTLKIGYVSPQTGPLAGFGEADNFVLGGVRKALQGRPGASAARTHPVEILVRDSQSDPNRAAEVASRPDPRRQGRPHAGGQHAGDDQPGRRPVRGQRRALHLERRPVAAVVLRPQRRPREAGFKWTYHFFWGLEDIIARLPRHVEPGDDEQGRRRAVAQRRRRQRLGRQEARLPAGARQGRLQARRPRPLPEPHRRLLGADRRLQEGERRDRHRRADPARLHDLLEAGRPAGLPAQGRLGRQGAAVPALGRGARRPRRRHVHRGVVEPRTTRSSRRSPGQTAAELAAATRAATKKQWTQPLGFVHALFEVAVDVLKRAATSTTSRPVVAAIKATNLDTIVGPITWSGGPGAQRRQDAAGRRPVAQERRRRTRSTWSIVRNKDARPSIPTAGTLRADPVQA